MSKYHSGNYYVGEAQKHGLRVVPGRGDHYKIYSPDDCPERSMMTVPMHRELATGTECAIRKWFRKIGILISIAVLVDAICILSGLVQVF